ncbi:aminotransferase class V-fold PLP-dependent enzyme [uncultured Dokdonia sp.]|uniref:pyridoxal phosphate-dependent decarboxylase family protein n=1 Tax=uncultured Dokdonia sp. TaxID=575653 RepID=UPI002619F455|nr:aminotransferase class V-fold PLP-dependent enzyme [uncultured Dokdonia sp.]
MKKLVDRIIALEKISKELEPTEKERDLLNQEVQSYANRFIETLKTKPAFSEANVDSRKLKMGSEKLSLATLLEVYGSEVADQGIKPASGGHLGYIPGGGIYTAALADFLAAFTNEYAGMYFGSPGAVTIENELLDWMKGVFGFPKDAVGNLTSGGSIANLVALTAARDKHQIKNEKVTKSVIYMSPQVHHCIHKAIRIIGLEDVQVRLLALDALSKIDPVQLEETIKQDLRDGLQPFMVIASAGTTDTGAIDPLHEIGVIAKRHKLWYHVDGAYGGFFILAEEKKTLFKGIEMADSLVIDPHKSLFIPYGLGAVLVKDKEAVFHSHHYTANYMQDALVDMQINPADVSPELTKHFRGLRLWLPLQLHGLKPFVACLEEKLLLTTYFRNKLEAIGFRLGPEPDLSVSYFWYPVTQVEENKFNEKLMELMHQDGSVFLSSTRIDGRFVIRMAILSFRTKIDTIDSAMVMIKNCSSATKLYFKI